MKNFTNYFISFFWKALVKPLKLKMAFSARQILTLRNCFQQEQVRSHESVKDYWRICKN